MGFNNNERNNFRWFLPPIDWCFSKNNSIYSALEKINSQFFNNAGIFTIYIFLHQAKKEETERKRERVKKNKRERRKKEGISTQRY